VIVKDPKWDTLTLLAVVTDASTSMTAFRYTASEPGQSSPMPGTDLQPFRDLREALAAPDGTDPFHQVGRAQGPVLEELRPRSVDFAG
jgi:hypothetical protein